MKDNKIFTFRSQKISSFQNILGILQSNKYFFLKLYFLYIHKNSYIVIFVAKKDVYRLCYKTAL